MIVATVDGSPYDIGVIHNHAYEGYFEQREPDDMDKYDCLMDLTARARKTSKMNPENVCEAIRRCGIKCEPKTVSHGYYYYYNPEPESRNTRMVATASWVASCGVATGTLAVMAIGSGGLLAPEVVAVGVSCGVVAGAVAIWSAVA